MKVLFLDIDGVLNGHEKHPDSPYTTIRPDCVQRLNAVILATACQLVISSAWRYMLLQPKKKRERPPMTVLGFQYMLHTHGLYFHHSGCKVIGFTGPDEEIPERGGQILAWLKANPDAERWAVVDDDPMAIELGEHRRRLVRTDGETGMQDQDVVKLIRLLGKR